MEKEHEETASGEEEALEEKTEEPESLELLRNELEGLREQLMEERAYSKNYLEAAKRIQADFDNYKKRQQKEMEKIVDGANDRLISDLLTIIDDFERALDAADSEEFVVGVKQIHTNFTSLLKGYGLREIPTGVRFNPDLHEALSIGEGEEGTILEVYQKGYFLGNKVIRYSKVKVGKQEEEGE